MAPATEFLTFAAVGALAQLVDGALGMAYGVAGAAMLLGLGMPPVTATASVHQAEAFTCGASGLSHWLAGNVRWPLFWMLAVPGVMGAVAGASIVARLPAPLIRMALTPYLLGMGVLLLLRGGREHPAGAGVTRGTPVLGLAAGFADAVAGGGWSALTVTTLMARGATPRTVIGTVHLAKCAVSVAAGASFLYLVGPSHGAAVPGLIAGGVLATPVGAVFARRMPARVATALAAIAVLGLGMSNVVKLMG